MDTLNRYTPSPEAQSLFDLYDWARQLENSSPSPNLQQRQSSASNYELHSEYGYHDVFTRSSSVGYGRIQVVSFGSEYTTKVLSDIMKH